MKKILAIVLCAAMIFKFLPAMSIRATENSEQLAMYHNGIVAEAVVLPQNEKVELTAATSVSQELAYQWQILAYGDLWVNIEGKTDASIDLSYALVANLLTDGVAKVRCKALSDAGELCSQEVSVTVEYASSVSQTDNLLENESVDQEEKVDESGADVSENESEVSGNDAEETVTQQYATFNVQRVTTRAAYGVVPANETEETPTTYSIMIKYEFADGKQAANPWTATVAAGSSFTQTVTSPTVLGYTPDQASVALNYSDIDEDKTVTVKYAAALVDYTVVHYQQNLNDDNYTLVERKNKTGYTESPVGEGLEISYEGFYSLFYDTTIKIAADGSTVVEIYYDRYYYLMSFNLDGGYGVEPIYARYGAPISVGSPTKEGYNFVGWEPTLNYTTMPAENTSYIAKWNAGTTSYDVVFWYENADDNDYSQAGVREDVSATAGSVVNGSIHQNFNFDGRDNDHFTYNHADENVIVKGDGSTIVNVYFSRNVYTLTFQIYSNRKYTTIYTINAKYQAYIGDKWEFTGSNGIMYPQTNPVTSWDPQKNSVGLTQRITHLELMPGGNVTFHHTTTSYETRTFYYYVESLTGTVGDKVYEGKSYDLHYTLPNDFNYVYYNEDFFELEGFTRYRVTDEDDDTVNLRPNDNVSAKNILNFYYHRNTYDLAFSNMGTTVSGKGGSVQYQALLQSYNFTPDYPSNLEPNAYIFEGWYTSPFYGDTKVDFDTAKMPASDLTLYARWVPTMHNVDIYITNEMKLTDKIGETQIIPHRELATAPDEPTNGDYTFVGWFYMDGDTEKAFDFSMPVTHDLDLYAKWSSNVLMEYTIKYAVENEDGKLTYIAEDTTGSGLAGTTKTFEAKAGDELYDGYQSGYFPETNSHSLTIDIEDSSENEFTFIYIEKPSVKYTVKYMEIQEDGTRVPMKKSDGTDYPDKVASTKDAVVTETFVAFNGYMPDAYQKRLVLSADETQNVIIFWYVKDDTHAPVQIVHYIQNAEGDGYTEYQSSTDLNGFINNTYSTNVLTISGYTYDHATANDVAVTAGSGKVTGTVTEEGLILELYYNRNLYPYEFRFLEQGTNVVLADSVTGNARYGSQVTQKAKNIPGYTCSDGALAMTIQIEDGDIASKNVRIFYYTEQEVVINYVAVGPEGAGTVNPEAETVKVFTGNASGSTPTANEGYRFVGWYTDENCTVPVEAVWVSDDHITPQKTEDYGGSEEEKFGYKAATYYALFELGISDLTIKKQLDKSVGENQNFIFEVSGIKGTNTEGFSLTVVVNIPEGNFISNTVTLVDLPIGSYTVTEQNNWRYQTTDSGYKEKVDSTQDITLVADSTQNIVTFYNKRVNDQWLSESVNKNNQFVGVYKGTN